MRSRCRVLLPFLGLFTILMGFSCVKSNNQATPAAVQGKTVPATLKRLHVNIGDVTPEFDSQVFAYSLSGGETSAIRMTINAAPTDFSRIVKVNGKKVSSDYTSDSLSLQAGSNDFTITVHDESDVLLNTYTLSIKRTAELAEADLAGIAVSNGDIVPSFDPEILDYTLSVPANYSLLTISPQLFYPEISSLSINNKSYDPQIGSYDFDLVAGSNPFQIKITGPSGKTKSYTLVVTRG